MNRFDLFNKTEWIIICICACHEWSLWKSNFWINQIILDCHFTHIIILNNDVLPIKLKHTNFLLVFLRIIHFLLFLNRLLFKPIFFYLSQLVKNLLKLHSPSNHRVILIIPLWNCLRKLEPSLMPIIKIKVRLHIVKLKFEQAIPWCFKRRRIYRCKHIFRFSNSILNQQVRNKNQLIKWIQLSFLSHSKQELIIRLSKLNICQSFYCVITKLMNSSFDHRQVVEDDEVFVLG